MTQPDSPSRQLADILRADIKAGVYPPGAKLPSYRQLRDGHHVALNTAQAAIRLLAADGLVVIRPALGAYVQAGADEAGPTLRTELADLQAVVRRSRKDLAKAEKAITGLLARLPTDGQVP